MYIENLINIYIHRLKPINFRDSYGRSLTEESEHIEGINLGTISDMYSEDISKEEGIPELGNLALKPDLYIVGDWVATIREDNQIKPYSSFIINNKGTHVMLVTGIPFEYDIDKLIPTNHEYVNEVYDKVKKILYVIISKNNLN